MGPREPSLPTGSHGHLAVEEPTPAGRMTWAVTMLTLLVTLTRQPRVTDEETDTGEGARAGGGN